MGWVSSVQHEFELAAAAVIDANGTVEKRLGPWKRLTLLIRSEVLTTITVYLSLDGSDWFEIDSTGLVENEETVWTIEHSATWVRVKTSQPTTWTVKASVLRG